jgi:ABC-type branched-subunit amino acid transport system ATPase component
MSAGLALVGLTVDFGGLRAVDHLDLDAPAGSITGLIGPNGAGKTTTFNACTGSTPAAGTVQLADADLTKLPAHARAAAGLGRTFQRTELVGSMSVLENVALGGEARAAGRTIWSQVIARRADRDAIRSRARDSLDRLGILPLAHRPAADLSTGQRRLVELARAMTADFSFLLLDEPSAGLDEGETAVLGRSMQDLVDEHGIGILLVEHDMTLVRRTCAHVYVVDFGQLLCHGPTAEVLASDLVRDAYLGSVDA